ncbi:T-cell surface glycoprotein CD3 gamma chain isoform X1 [Pogona vitticeps]|uniref:T-cell surface glycoprotein CD3 gamma chain-like isoform X1 n=1 Tax=Pogona vitticeps TaxID=103695 RepID=A0A6J0TUH0_9SAUR|nr:T-cell surface glycoprotein CD3 gamma chain-like isoform X1 [Pogona vitticeps]
MGSSLHLLHATLLGLLFTGVVISENTGPQPNVTIQLVSKQKERTVSLRCQGRDVATWLKDGVDLQQGGQELLLGSPLDDPRGVYSCRTSPRNEEASLQVYFRMCQNCIQLDLPTVLGLLLASSVSTVFLAVAVYCLVTGEPGWQPQASDKQTLLANEQLYQPLGERNNGQYSHIGVANMRRR